MGGRYSVWSVAGLSIALTVGAEVLIGMRAGAEAMDQHFRLAPLASNAPAQLALAGLVNCSVLGHNSLNIAAYSARLLHLVTYLQQLEMESLGKRVAGDGQAVGVPSAPIIWGMPGTDGQHTFFQWLHQSENGAPVDFIASLQGCPDNPDAHRMLLANCLAQRQALLRGKSLEQALLDVAHIDDRERALRLARHMVHPGGRPSSLISCASSTRVAWARCWPCTSTRCSCRAWSGASIPSTNGAWSWASGWPPASSASWRCRCRRPWPTGARRVHVVLDRLLPGPRPGAAAAPCLGAGRRGASVSGARGRRPRGRPLPHNPYAVSGIPRRGPQRLQLTGILQSSIGPSASPAAAAPSARHFMFDLHSHAGAAGISLRAQP